MIFLNMMLPQYILEYAVISFFAVSLIEGIIINLGVRKNAFSQFGIILSFGLNIASTIAGLFVGLSISNTGPIMTVIGAFLGSVIIECLVASFFLINTPKNKKVCLMIVLGNVLTYILIWLTLPWMF